MHRRLPSGESDYSNVALFLADKNLIFAGRNAHDDPLDRALCSIGEYLPRGTQWNEFVNCYR